MRCCKKNIPAVDAKPRETTLRMVPTRRQKIVCRTLWAVLATGPEKSKMEHAALWLWHDSLHGAKAAWGSSLWLPASTPPIFRCHPMPSAFFRPAPPRLSAREATVARLPGRFAARGGPGPGQLAPPQLAQLAESVLKLGKDSGSVGSRLRAARAGERWTTEPRPPIPAQAHVGCSQVPCSNAPQQARDRRSHERPGSHGRRWHIAARAPNLKSCFTCSCAGAQDADGAHLVAAEA